MAATKASLAVWSSEVFMPLPNASAMAMAASFPDDTISPVMAAFNVSVSPAWSMADDSPI